MNCPNCDNKPVGLFYSFRLNGVNFKQKVLGYFRCRHCNTLLRQEKTSVIFPKFQKTFWKYYVLFVALIVGLGIGIFLTIEYFDFDLGVTAAMLAVYFVVLSAVGDELRSRFWVIREADPEEDARSENRLTKGGVAIFLAYALLSILIFLGIDQYIELREFSPEVLIGGYLCYLLAVIGVGIWLLRKLSVQKDEQQPAG